VRRNAKQPRDKRRTLPLKSGQSGQRLLKNFGGEVFRLFPVGDTASDEGVDTIEIGLVQFSETSGIALRSLDQKPLVYVLVANLQSGLRHALATYLMMRPEGKVTTPQKTFLSLRYPVQGLLS